LVKHTKGMCIWQGRNLLYVRNSLVILLQPAYNSMMHKGERR